MKRYKVLLMPVARYGYINLDAEDEDEVFELAREKLACRDTGSINAEGTNYEIDEVFEIYATGDKVSR
jgi:hypothetical protein